MIVQDFWIFEPTTYEVSFKVTFVCLSVCLSERQFSIFLKNGSSVFSDFLHDGR